jgi:hypothetical protein
MDKQRLAGEKRRLPESSYRRLFENEWATSEDRLASEDDLAACVVLNGPLDPKPGVRYVIGVDVGLRDDRPVCAVCHAEPIEGTDRRRVVLDRMQVWQGSRLRAVQLRHVEEWLQETSRRYNKARIRFDPYQAIGSMQRLKRAGVRVEEFTFSAASVGRIATTLLQLIRERELALPDDEELLDELRNVHLRESSPGVFRLDHDRGQHDDRAVALALAATALIERPEAQPARTISALIERRGGRTVMRAPRRSVPIARAGGITTDPWGTYRSDTLDAVTGSPLYTAADIERVHRRLRGGR